MDNDALNELKQMFFHYGPFWEEWKRYRLNGLKPEEIYALDIQIRNEFLVKVSDPVRLWNQSDFIEGITSKLKDNYITYQNWLILKFQTVIINKICDIPLERLTNISNQRKHVSQKNEVLEAELAEVLLSFNCTYLSDLLYASNDSDLRDPDKFEVIQEFMIKLKIKDIVFNHIKREIKSVPENQTYN